VAGMFRRVGLVFSQSSAYSRGVLRGVHEYSESRPYWTLILVGPTISAVAELARMRPAGVIANVYSEAIADAVVALEVPFVNVSGIMRDPPLPRVGTDEYACGCVAARYFLSQVNLGFRSFAFVGTPGDHYSVRRERGYKDTVEAAGYRVLSHYEPTPEYPADISRHPVGNATIFNWLSDLPRPVGLFTSDDSWGFQLTELCRQMAIRVPYDVSIVGADNDDVFCNLARPFLSSIAIPAHRIGLQAASLLDRLIDGSASPAEPLLLPPGPVISRPSSDFLAIADDEVSTAVRYIRSHSHSAISVDDVVSHVFVGRRSLERRFRVSLGRSILDEIRQSRIERACHLLTETELSIEAVAESSGFSSAKHLWSVFREFLNTTPHEYRKTAETLPHK